MKINSEKKSKFKTLTLKEKNEIIIALDHKEKQCVVAKRYKVSPSTISKIYKEKEKVIENVQNNPLCIKKVKKSSYEEIDCELLKWFTIQKSKNVPITLNLLNEKSIEIAKKLNIENFKGSISWARRFKKRHNITYGTVSGESKSVDMSVVNHWLKVDWPTIRQGYSDADIFNGDESGLFFRLLPNKTLKYKGENCHGGKLSKERLKIWLASSLLGEKAKPLIIGKPKNLRCFKGVNVSKYSYFNNSNAWMVSIPFHFQNGIITFKME